VYCLLCEDALAVADSGYCKHCQWILRAEIEEGWRRLRRYLRSWASFRDWELAHAALDPDG
jgi:hypothetical protein